jgi:hypothetical protein
MRTLFVLLLSALTAPVFATGTDGSAGTVATLLSQQHEIRKQVLEQTGRYEEMPAVKRDAILAEQNKLFRLLEGKSSTAELDPAQQTEVFNALETISSNINNTEDERIVCERVKKTGSHQVTRVCKSVAQIRVDRERARAEMSGRGICNSDACRPGALVPAGQQR